MHTRRRALKIAVSGVATALTQPFANAQDSSTITILVGFTTTIDFTARLVAERLRDVLGHPVIVVSKLGAGGRLALSELKRAAPDGKTLAFSATSPFVIYPHTYKKLEYDPTTDFVPIANVSTFDLGIATGPATGATDLKQLIAWGKKQSDDVMYGVPGSGSSAHFMGIALGQASGVRMQPVQYKDGSLGVIDVSAGRLPVMITGTGNLTEMHKSGRVKIVAVTGTERSSLVPDVPTLKEVGVDMSMVSGAGLFAPAGLPPDLSSKISDVLKEFIARPDVKEKLSTQGMVSAYMPGAQFARWIEKERGVIGKLAQASGYAPE